MSMYRRILRRVHQSHQSSLGVTVCPHSLCSDIRDIIQSQVRYGLKIGDHWLVDSNYCRPAFETFEEADAYRKRNCWENSNVTVVAYHLAPDGGVV